MKSGFTKVLVLALPLLAACESGSGPEDDASVSVFMSAQAASGLNAAQAGLLESSEFASLDLSLVDSINITLTSVEVQRADATGEESGWVTLELTGDGDGRIDLSDLPSIAGDSILLARGDLEAGSYSHIRLRYDASSARITLSEAVVVGQQTFEAGSHPLVISSGEQTGIKVQLPAAFTVAEDESGVVVLVLDANTSVRNVVATGSGTMRMNPVLQTRARSEDD